MIIHSIELVNFLKYETAKVAPLPETGLIEITGDNESGKTSLGSAVSFALYGRTPTLAPENIRQCVRWGTRRASVTIELSDGQNQRYRLSRSITDEGQMSAELLSLSTEQAPISNLGEVTKTLHSIFNLKFEEYQQTIYFTQDAPPTIDSVYLSKMCGMDAVRALANDLANWQHSAQEEDATIGARASALETELRTLEDRLRQLDALRQKHLRFGTDLDNVVARSQELSTVHAALQKKQTDLQAAARNLDTISTNDSWETWVFRLEQLEDRIDDIDQLLPRLGDSEPPRGISGKLRAVVDDARVLLSGFQAILELLTPRREELDQLLTANTQEAKLTAQITQSANTRSMAWIGIAATGVVYLALTLFMNIFSQPLTGLSVTVLMGLIGAALALLGRKNNALHQSLQADLVRHQETLSMARKEASEMDKLATLPLFRALEVLQDHSDEMIQTRALQFADGPGSDLTDHQRIRTHTREIVKETEAFVVRLQPTLANIVSRSEKYARDLLRLEHEKEQTEQESIDLELLIRPAYEIESDIHLCADERAATQRRLTILDTAAQLLYDSSEQMNRRFNQDLRKIISAILPALTNGHYHAARIAAPFQLEVFSQERQDFIPIEQLSNGTRRQILLAFRLALAEHLVSTRELGSQFIFLDEPFAFFDEQRTRETLALLPRLSARLAQIWVTGQAFPENTTADLRITCERQQTKLNAGL